MRATLRGRVYGGQLYVLRHGDKRVGLLATTLRHDTPISELAALRRRVHRGGRSIPVSLLIGNIPRTSLRTIITPPPVVEQCFRADFRIQFVVNGFSRAHNYKIVRHMFLRRTEAQSISRETDPSTVCVQTLDDRGYEDDDVDDNVCQYPLHTDVVPPREMRAIKHAWAVLRHVWRFRCTGLRGGEPRQHRCDTHAHCAVSHVGVWRDERFRRETNARLLTSNAAQESDADSNDEIEALQPPTGRPSTRHRPQLSTLAS